jgi:hypothetical protein
VTAGAVSTSPGAVFERLPRSVQATLLRIGRRITEGFEGEVTVAAKRGGVAYLRWIQTETGDVIREELDR